MFPYRNGKNYDVIKKNGAILNFLNKTKDNMSVNMHAMFEVNSLIVVGILGRSSSPSHAQTLPWTHPPCTLGLRNLKFISYV